MPKQRITKEIVVETAFQLARKGGMELVLIKNIAEKIGCSVQPIYCYCKNMDGLKNEVISYTKKYMDEFIKKRLVKDDLLRSSGFAYAAFAKEEPCLYRLYFLRDREKTDSLDGILKEEGNPQIVDYMVQDLKIARDQAVKLYTYMLIFNTGISMILSTLGEHADIEEIVDLQEGAYKAFCKNIIV